MLLDFYAVNFSEKNMKLMDIKYLFSLLNLNISFEKTDYSNHFDL